MKIQITIFFLVSMFFTGSLNADNNSWSPDFLKGEVVWKPSLENKIRNTDFTNVFHSVIANGFTMKNLSEKSVALLSRELGNEDVFEQKADFQSNNGNVIFEVEYYTTDDKVVGGKKALVNSTFYFTTMTFLPKYIQYVVGPGNLCIVEEMTNVSAPTMIKEIFFCRDNVAVKIKNLQSENILTFAQLLDACILASEVEEP